VALILKSAGGLSSFFQAERKQLFGHQRIMRIPGAFNPEGLKRLITILRGFHSHKETER
jgi:hypothetical protein